MEKKYKVVWSPFVTKQLKKVGNPLAEKITQKVEEYLSLNPSELGKQLSHQEWNIYSYRFGDWQIIYQIQEAEVLILVTNIGHRRYIYQQINKDKG